jgi:hypothetical protein
MNAGEQRVSDRVQHPRRSIASTQYRWAETPSQEANMTHVYFHCSSPERVLLDARGRDVEDLTEARDFAVRVVKEFIESRGPDDWRAWMLRVSDADGEEIFLMPFAYVLGRPN